MEFEKYYYKTNEDNILIEPCIVVNNGTRVDSDKCSKCKHNKGFNDADGWIICEKICRRKQEIKPLWYHGAPIT